MRCLAYGETDYEWESFGKTVCCCIVTTPWRAQARATGACLAAQGRKSEDGRRYTPQGNWRGRGISAYGLSAGSRPSEGFIQCVCIGKDLNTVPTSTGKTSRSRWTGHGGTQASVGDPEGPGWRPTPDVKGMRATQRSAGQAAQIIRLNA